jgi:hypothetical protein
MMYLCEKGNLLDSGLINRTPITLPEDRQELE